MNRCLFVFLLVSSIAVVAPIAIAQTDPQSFSCARATPTAIVKKSVFPNSSFVLEQHVSNNIKVPVGIETFRLADGTKLTIENGGCESYSLSFRFETDRATAKIGNRRYWFNRIVKLLRQVQPGLESSQLKQGIGGLETYIAQHHNLELDKDIDYGGKEIRSLVTITNIAPLPKSKVVLEVRFYDGPL